MDMADNRNITQRRILKMININDLKKGDIAYFLVPSTDDIAHGTILDYKMNEDIATVALKCSHYPYFGMHSETNTDLYKSEKDAKDFIARRFADRVRQTLDCINVINNQSDDNIIKNKCHDICHLLSDIMIDMKCTTNNDNIKSSQTRELFFNKFHIYCL